MSSREATPSSSGWRVASRSSSIAWMFAGSAIATRSVLAVERVRQRDDALEHVERDMLRRLGVDTASTARSTSGSW